MQDSRNVIDEFKGRSIDDIVDTLDKRGVELEIAIENLSRDFNMGTIVRSANAFGVRHIHIIGSKQWNKRGAMMTDKYLHVHYYADASEFSKTRSDKKLLIAIENNVASEPLGSVSLPLNAILVFGSEGEGLSGQMLASVDRVLYIEQTGSTRSLNVGVAAGIAMYQWLQDNKKTS